MKEGSFIIDNYTSYRNKIIYLLTNSEMFDKSIELNSVTGIVDMSINHCVVERNCPRLLTDFTQLIKEPEKYGEVNSKYCFFLPYKEENIGITYCDDDLL